MIVWNPADREIIGGYRFILGEDIEIVNGVPRIATSHMFRFSERFISEFLPETIELGRSFVALAARRRHGVKFIYVAVETCAAAGITECDFPQSSDLTHGMGRIEGVNDINLVVTFVGMAQESVGRQFCLYQRGVYFLYDGLHIYQLNPWTNV